MFTPSPLQGQQFRDVRGPGAPKPGWLNGLSQYSPSPPEFNPGYWESWFLYCPFVFLRSDFRFLISGFWFPISASIHLMPQLSAGDVVVKHYPRTCRNGKIRDQVGGQRHSSPVHCLGILHAVVMRNVTVLPAPRPWYELSSIPECLIQIRIPDAQIDLKTPVQSVLSLWLEIGADKLIPPVTKKILVFRIQKKIIFFFI